MNIIHQERYEALDALRGIAALMVVFFHFSFALYLVHQFISLGVLMPLLTNYFKINFWIPSVMIALPVVLILSTIITFYIDVPLNRAMKVWLRQLKPFGHRRLGTSR